MLDGRTAQSWNKAVSRMLEPHLLGPALPPREGGCRD